MWPWIWMWNIAPQWHLPWSGNIAQQIEPDLRGLFGCFNPQGGGGDPEIERRALGVSSYGQQLGWLTDLVLAAQDPAATASADAARAVEGLRRSRTAIETIKVDVYAERVKVLAQALEGLKTKHPQAYEELRRAHLRP